MTASEIRTEAWLAAAEYFIAINDWPAAEAALRRELLLDSTDARAYTLLARALKYQKRKDEAGRAFFQAAKLEPENPDYLYNLALFHQENGELAAAEKIYLELINKYPAYADALANLGRLYQDSNQPGKALLYYHKDLALRPNDPDSHFNLAFMYLLTGDYSRGWKEYEWRFKRTAVDRTYPHSFTQPRWQGENFAGKTLLVHGEQGFGDNLQFLRYLPPAKRRGGRLLFEIPRQLCKLLQNHPGIDQLLIFDHQQAYPKAFDYYIPLMSLARVFQTDDAGPPPPEPLIKAPGALCRAWRARLTGKAGFKVGLVWGGHPVPDPARSCPALELAPLLELDDIDFYGLQTGPPAEEARELKQFSSFRGNLGPEWHSFADTAAVIANLDLVITIDTATAHLAGAMGKAVWTMLPFAPDWRWGLEQEKSPWYPSMCLFRQSEPGNWQAPLAQIKTRLNASAVKNLKTRPEPQTKL